MSEVKDIKEVRKEAIKQLREITELSKDEIKNGDEITAILDKFDLASLIVALDYIEELEKDVSNMCDKDLVLTILTDEFNITNYEALKLLGE